MAEDNFDGSLIYKNSAAGFGFLRQWTAEFDVAKRRLKIVKRWLGRSPKTIVDCSFDECTAVGTIEYQGEDGPTYGTYVQLKNGKLHGIPSYDYSFEAAVRTVKELSAATRIPRRDTRYP